MTNPERREHLCRQAATALAALRELREKEASLLRDRRSLMPGDDRIAAMDATHLRLVKQIRDCETALAPLQGQIEELEVAQRKDDAAREADAKATAETEIAQAVKDRLDAAAKIDAALALLADGFRAWDSAGTALARHEAIHGRAPQVIFSGRVFRAAIHAAAGDTALPKALELARTFDGCAPALETEIGLWAAYLPKKNAA